MASNTVTDSVTETDEWFAAWDERSKRTYYFNQRTQESVWSLPEGATLIGRVEPSIESNTIQSDTQEENDNLNRVEKERTLLRLGFPRVDGTCIEGWMFKSDPKGRNWKKRWIEVDTKSSRVCWYKNNPAMTLAKYRTTETAMGSLKLLKGKMSAFIETAEQSRTTVSLSELPRERHGLKIMTHERMLKVCCLVPKANRLWYQAFDTAIQGKQIEPLSQAVVTSESGKAMSQTQPIQSMRQSTNLNGQSLETGAEQNISGWLMKHAPRGNAWAPRFVVLNDGLIKYYEDDSMSTCKGIININSAQVEYGLPEKQKQYAGVEANRLPAFQIAPQTHLDMTAERIYVFCAHSHDELDRWMTALHVAAHSQNHILDGSSGTSDFDKSRHESNNVVNRYNPLHSNIRQGAGKDQVNSGWLYKADPHGRHWKKRWFKAVLSPNVLVEYYSDPSVRVKKGEILMNGAAIDFGHKFVKAPTVYTLTIETPTRTFFLSANTEEDMRRWYTFLCTAAARCT